MTITDFFDLIRPGLAMCIAFINIPVFGVPLWQILLGLFVFSFVMGFIGKGLAFSGSFISTANRGSRNSGYSSSDSLKSSDWVEHSDSLFYYDNEG